MPPEFDIQLDGGWASRYFVTNPVSKTAELTDPLVMLSTLPLLWLADERELDAKGRIGGFIIPDTVSNVHNRPKETSLPVRLLEKAFRQGAPLLVLAPEFGPDALETMVINKLRGIILVCAVKLRNPDKQALEALATRLGIVPFQQWESADADFSRVLGRCSKVVCHEDSCCIRL